MTSEMPRIPTEVPNSYQGCLLHQLHFTRDLKLQSHFQIGYWQRHTIAQSQSNNSQLPFPCEKDTFISSLTFLSAQSWFFFLKEKEMNYFPPFKELLLPAPTPFLDKCRSNRNFMNLGKVAIYVWPKILFPTSFLFSVFFFFLVLF